MSVGNIVGSAAFRLVMDKGAFSFGMRDAQAEAEGAVSQIAATLHNFGRAITQTGLALSAGVTTPIVGLSKAIFEIGTSFESAFAGVAKTFPGTIDQLAEFRDTIREMANEMPATREEIAAVAESAGQLGIEVEGLEEFTRTMVMLGETTNLSAEQAALSLARLANIMNTNASEFAGLGAAVVDLGNKFAATESEIVNMAARIAGAGQVVGLTESEVLSLATALASVGIRVEAGGSAISRVLIAIANAVAEGSADLELFAQTASLSVSEFSRLFEEDAAQALVTFIDGLSRVDDEGGNVFTLLKDLELGELRVRDTTLRLAGSQGILNEALAVGADAVQEGTALTEEYGKRLATIDSQIDILKNQLTDIAVSLFDAFRPQIVAIVERIGEAIQGLTETVKNFADGLDDQTKTFIVSVLAISAVIGPALIAIGGLTLILSTLANPVGLAVVAIAALAGAFVLLKTNSEFALEHIPNLTIAANNLEDSFVNLASSINELLISLGLISSSANDAESSLASLGVVADITFGTLLAYPTLIVDEIVLVVNAFELIIDAIVLVGQAFNDLFNGLTISFEEFFKLISDPKRLLSGDIDFGATFDFSSTSQAFDELKNQGAELRQTGIDLAKHLMDGFTVQASIEAEKFDQIFSGLTLQEFRAEFKRTTTGAIGDFTLLRSHVLADILAINTEGSEGFRELVRSTESEGELIKVLFKGLGEGIITLSDLGIQKAQELKEATAENIKFLEDNAPFQGGELEIASGNVDRLGNALQTLGGRVLQFKDNITGAQNAINIWNQDLANNEKAIEITKRQIEETGDPTGELAKQLEILTYHGERLANGISDDLEPAFAKQVAAAAALAKEQEDLKIAFEDGKLSPEEYAIALEELNRKTEDTQDPFAQMVGDIGKIADSMADGIQAFKDVLVELGLLKDETGDPVEVTLTSNAQDTATDIENVGKEVEEVPESKEVSILSVLSGQAELEDYTGDLKDLPPEIITKLLANTDEADKKTRAQLELALGYAEGEYRAQIYADTTEANKSVADLETNTIGFTQGEYSALITADTSDIDTKLEIVDTTLFGLTSGSYFVTIDADIQPLRDKAEDARRLLPSSPAEEGPLAFTPNWDWIFEGLGTAATTYSEDAMARVRNFIDTATAGVTLLSNTFDTLVKIFSGSGSLPNLDIEGGTDFLNPLFDFIDNIVFGLGDYANNFSKEVLEQTNLFTQTASSAVSLISAGFDALVKILEGPELPDLGEIGAENFLDPIFDFIGNVTQGIAELATSFSPESLAMASAFATSASTILDLMTKGAETLASLNGLQANLSQALQAVTDIKLITEAAVLAVGDTAAVMNSSQGAVDHPAARGEGFVGAAGVFAEEASKVLDAMIKGAEFIAALAGLDNLDLNSALEFVTKLKFIIEHMMLSMGDTAAVMNSSGGDVNHPAARGEGFIGAAAAFAESAETVVSLMTAGLEFIIALGEFSGQIDLDRIRSVIADLKFAIEHIVLSIGDTVQYLESIRGSGFVDGIEEFSAAVESAVGALTTTLEFMLMLGETAGQLSLSSDDVYAYVSALASVAFDIATIFDNVAQEFGETVEGSIERLSTAVSNSVGALAETLTFMITLGENVNSLSVSSEDVEAYGSALATNALRIALIFDNVAQGFEETVEGSIERLATAVGSATGALGSTLTFLTDLGSGIQVVSLSSEEIADLAYILSQHAVTIAEQFDRAAEEWNGKVHPESEALATAISNSLSAIGGVLSFLGSLTDAFAREEKINFGASITGIARLLAERGREAAEAFENVIRTWEIEEGVKEKVEGAAKVIQDSLGALNAVISFMNQVTDEGFELRGGQLRQVARQIADLGIEIGNMFASKGGQISVESQAGLDAYAIWFTNIQSIFAFLAAIQEESTPAIQNAYTFRDAAIEIAAAILEGSAALSSIGNLSDLAFGSGVVNQNANVMIGNEEAPGSPGSGGSGSLTLNLDIDGETFQTFIIDTVNGYVEEVF